MTNFESILEITLGIIRWKYEENSLEILQKCKNMTSNLILNNRKQSTVIGMSGIKLHGVF